MALYTLFCQAAGAVRTCAVVEAVSVADALREGARLRRDGDLPLGPRLASGYGSRPHSPGC